MSEIEELEAKYEALKKANIERDIAAEEAKLEEAKKAEEKKQLDAMRDEIRNELISEMKATSVVEDEPKTNTMLSDFDRYVYEPFYKRFHVEKTEGDTLEERYIKRIENARNKIPRNRGAF